MMYGTLEESPAAPIPFDAMAALEAAGMPLPEPVAEFSATPGAEGLTVLEGHTLERGRDDIPVEVIGSNEIFETLPGARSIEAGQRISRPVNPKDLLGMKKPDLSLVPPASNLYQAQAMRDGAAKYGPYNWRENPVLARVYLAAAQRHIAQYLDGEDFDPISGVHHIGHALACLGIIADARETGNLIDDRPLPGPSGSMIRRFNDTQSYR